MLCNFSVAKKPKTGKSPVPPARPRVVIADDHEDFLAEVSDFLSGEFDIIGTASDGAALVKTAATLRPHIVVTDLQMPKLSGIEAGRKILAEQFCTAVVIITVYADPKLARLALKSGIQGFVLTLKAGEDLIPAMHTALTGGTFVSPAIASALDSE